jgi:hypothetical protein
MADKRDTDVPKADAYDADDGIITKVVDGLVLPFSGDKDGYFSKTILFWTAVMYFILGFVIGNLMSTWGHEATNMPNKTLGLVFGGGSGKSM